MSMETTASATDVDIFTQLDTYPWDKDSEYQIGLSAILGPDPSPSQLNELTLRAKCFYLSRKKNIPIDFDAYKAHLSHQSSSTTNNNNISSTTQDSPTPQPATSSSTQLASTVTSQSPPQTPPHNRRLSTTTLPPTTAEMSVGASPTDPPKQAPYPATFAQIVALITSGAPIPGIVDIPNITLPHLASDPKVPKRKKPWEKEEPSAALNGEGLFGDKRDEYIPQELPE